MNGGAGEATQLVEVAPAPAGGTLSVTPDGMLGGLTTYTLRALAFTAGQPGQTLLYAFRYAARPDPSSPWYVIECN